MSKKRGLSLDEKRQKMIEIFYEKKDFFSLKELEKIGPKEKGIVSQSVKDVIQGLVDDGLVDSEKIGTSIYFWAFPSKAVNNRKRKIDDLEGKLKEVSNKLKVTNESIAKAKIGREETEERRVILDKLETLKKEKETVIKSIQKFKDNDPEVLESMKKDVNISKEAINRWTDNIFAVKSWCKSKFFMEEETLNKQFCIDPEMDYIN
ncbi:Meiotic nuclear division protein 1 [Chamberlinius hualienensis]